MARLLKHCIVDVFITLSLHCLPLHPHLPRRERLGNRISLMLADTPCVPGTMLNKYLFHKRISVFCTHRAMTVTRFPNRATFFFPKHNCLVAWLLVPALPWKPNSPGTGCFSSSQATRITHPETPQVCARARHNPGLSCRGRSPGGTQDAPGTSTPPRSAGGLGISSGRWGGAPCCERWRLWGGFTPA